MCTSLNRQPKNLFEKGRLIKFFKRLHKKIKSRNKQTFFFRQGMKVLLFQLRALRLLIHLFTYLIETKSYVDIMALYFFVIFFISS